MKTVFFPKKNAHWPQDKTRPVDLKTKTHTPKMEEQQIEMQAVTEATR